MHLLAAAAAVDMIKVPQGCCLEPDEDEALRRVRFLVRSPNITACYVGSTSDPKWRWQGGRYPSDDGVRYMPGHHGRYDEMHVIGTWPDARTAAMEVLAISEARMHAYYTADVDNVANDARGLEIRRYAHSFLYVCISVWSP